MLWCPKCKYEYREGFTFCSDCGRELVEVLGNRKEKKKFVKKSLILIAFVFILSLFYFIPQISFNNDTNAAKKVVREYFQYTNNGNVNAVIKTMTGTYEHGEGLVDEINNTRFVKLLYVKDAPGLVSSYMNNGIGAIEKPYEVRIFNIIFYKLYKNQKLSPVKSGIRSIHIDVTKVTKDAPWRITGMGEG